MTDDTSHVGDALLARQRAFLLWQLAVAPHGRLTQSEANRAIPAQLKKELRLAPAKAAKELRRAMVAEGLIGEETSGRNVTYSITEAGRQKAHDLERYAPLLPANGTVNPPADERARTAREVYVLDALARAAGHTITKAALDAGFGGRPKLKAAELAAKHPEAAAFRDQHCLGLNPATARAVLSELALRGDISVRRADRTESYTLTAGGTELLGRLRGSCPVLPPTGKPPPPPNESVSRAREAFLLLKLLEAPQHAASAREAEAVGYPKAFKLNHAAAWLVRDELARDGHVAVRWDGTEGSYALTPSGRRHLATLSFDAFGEFKIQGAALTELLKAAREGTPAGTRTPVPRPSQPEATAAPLEDVVLGIFSELLRERHAVVGMVPIYEIRRVVAERHGARAASHAVLDDLLLGLRRAKRVGLVSISDRSRADTEQLQDSVFAVGETFFYVEQARAHHQAG